MLAKAVADKAAAVVGIFSFTGDAILPILEAGKTALVRQLLRDLPDGVDQPELSFPMGNQPLYAVGLVKHAVEDGCKNINGVIIEGAEAFKPLMDNAAKALKARRSTSTSPCRRPPRTTAHRWRKRPVAGLTAS